MKLGEGRKEEGGKGGKEIKAQKNTGWALLPAPSVALYSVMPNQLNARGSECGAMPRLVSFRRNEPRTATL